MMTRDQKVSDGILVVTEAAEGLVRHLSTLVEDAERHDATLHAALYGVVQGHLASAAISLASAYRVMSNGDPDEFDNPCEGHPAGPFDAMGETVYCDGTCRQ